MDPIENQPEAIEPDVVEVVPTRTPRSPYLAIFVIILALLAIVGLAAYYVGRTKTPDSVPVPTMAPTEALVSPEPTTEEEPTPTVEPTATPAAQVGTVKGKLCYPSSFLPKGTIEAKNIDSDEIFTQDYPGSDNGGKNTYSFELKPGEYYLRYNTDGDLEGYHTETCPTGMETSCKQENERVLIAAEVGAGETVEGHDLCDFYYSEETKPDF